MGGSIGLVFRDSDGTVHKGTAWSNLLKGYVHNPRFLAKNRAWMFGRYGLMGHVQKRREAWPADPAVLAPIGYGLTVIDWQRDKILHLSSYNDLETWHWGLEAAYGEWGRLAHLFRSGVYTLPMELDAFASKRLGKKGPVIDPHAPNLAEQLRTLFTAAMEVKGSKALGSEDLRPLEYEGVSADIYPFAYRDYSGWGGSKFSPRRRLTQMIADIEALGFELTEEETQLWVSWIRDNED